MKELMDYVIQHTDRRFDALQAEIKELRELVAKHDRFMWKVVGIWIGVMGIVQGAATFLPKFKEVQDAKPEIHSRR